MSDRTTTERITRFVGQSVQVGEVFITIEKSNGRQVQLTVAADPDVPILVPMGLGFIVRRSRLAQDARGWWRQVPHAVTAALEPEEEA